MTIDRQSCGSDTPPRAANAVMGANAKAGGGNTDRRSACVQRMGRASNLSRVALMRARSDVVEGDASRNLLLDLLRGLAAIAVVALHIGDMVSVRLVPGGYLAVDFFFVLSGYVIARAYDGRLAGTMTSGRFIGMRLVRLYPLFFAGALLGLFKTLAQTYLHARFSLEGGHLALAAISNFLMLPYLLPYPSIFPLNAPAWSLSLELLVNVLYAWLLFRMRTLPLVLIALVAAAAIVAGPFAYGTDRIIGGSIAHELPFGLARVFFGFPVGMLIARLPGAAMRRRSALVGTFLAILVLSCLVLPLSGTAGLIRDLAFVLAIGPIVVWLGAQFEVPQRWSRAAAFLGDLSYPLYITHYPILLGVTLVGVRRGAPPGVTIAAAMAIALIFAVLIERYYDAPVRKWLSSRVRQRESAPPLSMAIGLNG